MVKRTYFVESVCFYFLYLQHKNELATSCGARERGTESRGDPGVRGKSTGGGGREGGTQDFQGDGNNEKREHKFAIGKARRCGHHCVRSENQGSVVQKQVNANLGLRVNQGFCFFFC